MVMDSNREPKREWGFTVGDSISTPAGMSGRRIGAPPKKVAEAAAGKNLGDLQASEGNGKRLGTLVAGVGTSIGLLIVAVALTALAGVLGGRVTVWACLAYVAAVVWLLGTFWAMTDPAVATYLFANGLVQCRNRSMWTVTWTEIDELVLWTSGGHILRHYVVTFDGTRFAVPYISKDLGHRLRQIVAEHGRPIRETENPSKDGLPR